MARTQEIVDRAINAVRLQTLEAWDAVKKEDTWVLAIVFKRARKLVLDNLDMTERCPECLDNRWGRPVGASGSGMDFTKRQCADCGFVREGHPEDEDEPETYPPEPDEKD